MVQDIQGKNHTASHGVESYSMVRAIMKRYETEKKAGSQDLNITKRAKGVIGGDPVSKYLFELRKIFDVFRS